MTEDEAETYRQAKDAQVPQSEADFAAPKCSTAPAGLLIHCSHCGRQLMQAGALLFSPPANNGTCFKYHFCAGCYAKVGAFLAQ